VGDTFLERHGYKRTKNIQLRRIDNDLKNRIWNRVYDFCPSNTLLYERYEPTHLMKAIWRDFFKADADSFSYGERSNHIHWMNEKYFKLQWYRVYDFLEFIVDRLSGEERKGFIADCNKILESERSGYRFVGNRITNIITDKEMLEIEDALHSVDEVSAHIKSALSLYSNRSRPDYRNSIKESVSAVEAMCKKLTKSESTLPAALKMLDKNPKVRIPGSLKGGFEKIYGYTSSTHGIRHGFSEVQETCEEDARFMLIACSAFINYLKVKGQKAGILDKAGRMSGQQPRKRTA
jgi:hypothetical protein